MKSLFQLLGLPFLICFLNVQLFSQALTYENHVMFNENNNLTNRDNYILVDDNYNMYMAGLFEGTLDANPGSGTFNLNAAGGGSYDIYIIKLDSLFNFVWAGNMGGVGAEYLYSMEFDGSGNIILGGAYARTSDFDPGTGVANLTPTASDREGFLVSIDQNGSYNWAKSFQTENRSIIRATASPNDSFIYVTGEFNGKFYVDPNLNDTTNFQSDSTDIFVIKLTESGDYVWGRHLQNTGMVRSGYHLASDPIGNVYVTGAFWETMDFDPGPGTVNRTAIGEEDVFLLRLDAQGNFDWVRTYGDTEDDASFDVHYHAGDNSVFLYADFEGEIDFGEAANPHVYKSRPINFHDKYVLKADADNGDFIWLAQFESQAGLQTKNVINVNGNGEVFVCGFFSDTIEVGPYPSVVKFLGGGSFDTHLMRISANGRYEWGTVIGGNGAETPNQIFIDNNDNVYISGTADGTLDLDPGEGVANETATDWLFGNGWFVKLSRCSFFNSSYTGLCLDTTGNPMTAGIAVLYDNDIRLKGGIDSISIVNIDNNGQYSFNGLDVCNAIIQIRPDESVYPELTNTYHGDSVVWNRSKLFKVWEGNDPDPVNCLPLRPRTSSGNNRINGTIYSNVTGKNGKTQANPIDDEDIILMEVPPGSAVARIKSNNSGYYTFDGLGNGNYEVVVDRTGIPMNLSGNTVPFTSNGNQEELDARIDSLEIVTGTSVSIPIVSRADVEIFPNPAPNDHIYAKFPENPGKWHALMFDYAGRMIQIDQKWDEQTLEIQYRCTPGVYFLQFLAEDSDDVLVHRVMVE